MKEKIYLFIGSFLFGSGSYLIHPGLALMVAGAIFLVCSYNEYLKSYGDKDTEESNTEDNSR